MTLTVHPRSIERDRMLTFTIHYETVDIDLDRLGGVSHELSISGEDAHCSIDGESGKSKLPLVYDSSRS
jgi:hypothetical protein